MQIEPLKLYTRPELEDLIGASALQKLRKFGGLQQFGDKYLGETIIDSWRFLCDVKRRTKEETRGESDEGSVETGDDSPELPDISAQKEPRNLPDQIAQIKDI